MLSGPASLVFPMTHTSGPRLRFLLKTTLVEGKLLATRAPYGKIRSYAICKKFPHALLCILVVGGFPCLLWGFIGADWFGDSILTCEEPEILFFHSVISFSLALHQGVCLISQSSGSLHLLWANLKCQMKRCQLGCSGPPRSFRSPSESQPKICSSFFFCPHSFWRLIYFLSSLILPVVEWLGERFHPELPSLRTRPLQLFEAALLVQVPHQSCQYSKQISWLIIANYLKLFSWFSNIFISGPRCLLVMFYGSTYSFWSRKPPTTFPGWEK